MGWRDYWEALLGLLFPEERACLACRGPLPETDPVGWGWSDQTDGRCSLPGSEPEGKRGARQQEDREAGRRKWESGLEVPHLPGWLPAEDSGWLAESGLCARCRWELAPLEPPFCLLCGRHLPEAGRCPECRRDTSFVLARSYGKYEGRLRDLLHRFKFSREAELGAVLGACLQTAWNRHLADVPVDWLVPVPLHPKRLQERGYNQAEQLALHLSSHTHIPCLPALRRVLHQKGQATRDRRERLKALQGTFVCDPSYGSQVRGATVLLVDDIYTTGSTAEACAQALRAAGAERVYVITVAR